MMVQFFKNYSVTEGLANDVINDVYEAGPDSFLVATNAGKLNTLVRGKIGVFKTTDNFTPVINHFSKSADHNLYAAADQGLFVLNNNRFSEIPIIIDTSGYKAQTFSFVYEWKNYLLLSTWNDNSKEKNILYDKVRKKVLDITYDHPFSKITHDTEKKQFFVTISGRLYILDTMKLHEGKIAFFSDRTLPISLATSFNQVSFSNAHKKWLFSNNALARDKQWEF